MTTDGSFYMIIPMDVVRNDTQVPHRIIAIDPGVRTLMTGYTPDGFIYHLGERDIQRLCRLQIQTTGSC
jgi:transposase